MEFFKRTQFFYELRLIFRSFFEYKKGLTYLQNRFLTGSKILKSKSIFSSKEQSTTGYSVHFLCGHRDLKMLLWSLMSWYKVVPESGKVYIHDDGSLNDHDKKDLKNLFPTAEVVDYNQISRQILNRLSSQFPKAHHYRKLSTSDRRYIYNLKLIDPFFVGDEKVKLILDSDLLWFKKPNELLDELLTKQHLPIFMGGYGRMDFVFSDGTSLPENVAGVNSGIVAFQKGQFLLSNLEDFFSRVGRSTNPHFVEQAGYAYILSKQHPPNFLPTEKYLIKGSVSESTILKHYTSPRREQFWFEGVEYLKDKKLTSKL